MTQGGTKVGKQVDMTGQPGCKLTGQKLPNDAGVVVWVKDHDDVMRSSVLLCPQAKQSFGKVAVSYATAPKKKREARCKQKTSGR